MKVSNGLTPTEKRLSILTNKVFHPLWTFMNVFYERGKELADCIVVCNDHVIIFSDKEIAYKDTGNLSVDWKRWENKAIFHQITQLRKAEKEIKKNPNNVFLDNKATIPIPVKLPPIDRMKIHLVCVANGATEACKKFFGSGTGSLRFFPNDDCSIKNVLSNKGLEDNAQMECFAVRDYEPDKTFVHIFDYFTLPFILGELDTISDFVDYLAEKERFIRSKSYVIYTGEEDLLVNYLMNFDDKRNCHCFLPPEDEKKFDGGFFMEEDLKKFFSSPAYKSKKEANKISYWWDYLIDTAAEFKLSGQTKTIGYGHVEGDKHEGAIRYMVLENRTKRRAYSKRMFESIENFPDKIPEGDGWQDFRSYGWLFGEKVAYFLYQTTIGRNESPEQYKERRMLSAQAIANCFKAKSVIENIKPSVEKVVGIMMEPPKHYKSGSTDFLLMDTSDWTEQQQIDSEEIMNKLGILITPLAQARHFNTKEYPDSRVVTSEDNLVSNKLPVNSPCHCGSGKKYKKCCGKLYS